jgi:hypothetical protein
MNVASYGQIHADVTEDIARLEAELADLRSLRKYLENKAKLDGRKTGDLKHNDLPKSNRFANAKQIDAAAIILREASEPLKTREIVRRLVAGGFPATDLARLKTSLFTTMTRKDTVFAKAGAGLWKLKESQA